MAPETDRISISCGPYSGCPHNEPPDCLSAPSLFLPSFSSTGSDRESAPCGSAVFCFANAPIQVLFLPLRGHPPTKQTLTLGSGLEPGPSGWCALRDSGHQKEKLRCSFMLSGIASGVVCQPDSLAIQACRASCWLLPELRPATPEAARLGRSAGSGRVPARASVSFEYVIAPICDVFRGRLSEVVAQLLVQFLVHLRSLKQGLQPQWVRVQPMLRSHTPTRLYSYLKAIIGSTFIALRAGTQQAAMATNHRSTDTVM